MSLCFQSRFGSLPLRPRCHQVASTALSKCLSTACVHMCCYVPGWIQVNCAIERNVYFEISYSPAIAGKYTKEKLCARAHVCVCVMLLLRGGIESSFVDTCVHRVRTSWVHRVRTSCAHAYRVLFCTHACLFCCLMHTVCFVQMVQI